MAEPLSFKRTDERVGLDTGAFQGIRKPSALERLQAAYPGGDFGGKIEKAPEPIKFTAFQKAKEFVTEKITGLTKSERDLQTALRKEGSPTDASFSRFTLQAEPTPVVRFSKPIGPNSSLLDFLPKLAPILNFVPRTILETPAKAISELYLLNQEFANWKGGAEPIKFPFDVRRIGFENNEPLVAVNKRFWKKVDDLATSSPDRNSYSIGLQALWEEVVPVSMDFIVTGDLITMGAKGVLKLTKYDPQVEWAFSKYGLTPQQFAKEGGVDMFKQRFTDIGKQLIEKGDYQGMNELARATQIIGNKMNQEGITALNPLMQHLQDTARDMVLPIQNIGRGYKGVSLFEPPPETALPGTRRVPGQAPAFGLSTEQIEPVGKGERIPASQSTPVDRRFVNSREIKHAISDLGNTHSEIIKKLNNNPEIINGRFNTFDDLENAIKKSLTPDEVAKITKTIPGYNGGDLQRVFDTKRAYASPNYYQGMAEGDQSYRFFETTKELEGAKNIVFRGEGAAKGPFYSGNLFGPGKYVSTDPSVAAQYGDVTKYTHNLKPKEIFDVPTQKALDKLYTDATKAYLDSPKMPNDLIPDYLKSKGYKAVRAVGELAKTDPLIGMNVFEENVLEKVIPEITKSAPEIAKALTPRVQDAILKVLPKDLSSIQPNIIADTIATSLVAEGFTKPKANQIAKTVVQQVTSGVAKKLVWHGTNQSGLTSLKPTTDSSASFGEGIYLTDNPDIAKDYGKNVLPISFTQNVNLRDLTKKEINELVSLFGAEQKEYIDSLLGKEFQGFRIPDRAGDGNEIVIFDQSLVKIADLKNQVSKQLQPFIEQAKKLTEQEFVSQFNEALGSHNLTLRETAQNISKLISESGFKTPKEFYKNIVEPKTNFPKGFDPYMRTITGDTVDIKKLSDPAYFVEAYRSTFARMAGGTDEKLYKILTKNLVPEGKEPSGYLADLYKKAQLKVAPKAVETMQRGAKSMQKPSLAENQSFLREIAKEVEAKAREPKKLIKEATVEKNIPPKKVIEKSTGVSKEKPETVTRTQKQLLTKEESVSRKAAKAGAAQMRTKILKELSEQNKTIKDIKTEIIEHVKNVLPVKDRGKALTIIRDAKNFRDLILAFWRIGRWAEEAEKKSIRNEILKQYKKAIESPSVAVDYKDKIKTVLADFELKGHTKETLESLKATKNFIEERVKAGEDVELPQRLWNALNILARKPFKDITLKELEGALQEINRLVDLGKLKWETKTQLYEYEKEAISKEILESTTPLNKLEILKPKIGEKLTAGQLFRNKIINTINWFNRTDKVLLPIDVLADMLDGGKGTFIGPNSSLIKRRIDYNFSNYLDTKYGIQDPVVKLAKEYKLRDGNFERMGIVAAREQEDGMEKLINSGYTAQEVNAIILTPEEQTVLDKMRETFEGQYPYIVQIMRDIYNQPVGKVKNYFSFMTDWKNMDEIEVFRRMGDKVEEFGKPTKNVEQGFTKERTGAGTQKIKVNALDVFMKHTDNVAYLRTMAKDSRMLFEVINSKEYGEKAGDLGQLLMLEWIDLVVRKGGKQGANQIAAIDFIRKNVGAAMLGFKLSSAAIQWTTVLDAAGLIGPEWAGKGSMAIATSKEWRQFVLKFPELKNRAGGEFAIKELQEGSWLNRIQEKGFIPLEKLDQLAAMSTAAGAYKRKMQELGLDIDLTQAPNKEAMQYAQLMVRRTQASPIFKDVPLAVSRGLLTGNRSLDRAMLQFQNFVLFRWALIRYEMIEAGIKGGNYKKSANLLFWLMMATLGVVGTRLGVNRLTDFVTGNEKKDPVAEEALKSMRNELMGTVPFSGNIFGAYMYDGELLPILSGPQEIFSGAKQAVTAKSLSSKAKGATDFISGVSKTFLGVPGTQQSQQIIKKSIPEPKKKSTSGLPSLPELPALPALPELPKLPSF